MANITRDSNDPKIWFNAQFIQEVQETLCAGSRINIDYDSERFREEGAKLPTGEYGIPMWKITLFWRFNTTNTMSNVTEQKLENIPVPGGQDTNTHFVGYFVVPNNAVSISLWFSYDGNNEVVSNVEPILWDSKFEENYNFTIKC